MPKLVVEIPEATRRHLDEVAAATGAETGEQLVGRLLDRWLDRHQAFWEYVEEGRRDTREGRWSDGEAFFAKLDAELEAEIAAQERIAAE